MRSGEEEYIISNCMNNLRKLIESELERTGWSTTALSKKIGLEAHYLNGILNNKKGTNLGLVSIVAILRYFKISFEELIGDRGRVTPISERIEEEYHLDSRSQRQLSRYGLTGYSAIQLEEKGYHSDSFDEALENILSKNYGKYQLSEATDEERLACLKILHFKMLNYLIHNDDVIPLITAISFAKPLDKYSVDKQISPIVTQEYLCKKLVNYLELASSDLDVESSNNSIRYW